VCERASRKREKGGAVKRTLSMSFLWFLGGFSLVSLLWKHCPSVSGFPGDSIFHNYKENGSVWQPI
jgi:hypothetical protein